MSSPALSSDSRRSVLLQHRSSPVRLIDPVTRESVDAAKAATLKERIAIEATRRAGYDGVDLRLAPSPVRVAYLEKAEIFMESVKGLGL